VLWVSGAGGVTASVGLGGSAIGMWRCRGSWGGGRLGRGVCAATSEDVRTGIAGGQETRVSRGGRTDLTSECLGWTVGVGHSVLWPRAAGWYTPVG